MKQGKRTIICYFSQHQSKKVLKEIIKRKFKNKKYYSAEACDRGPVQCTTTRSFKVQDGSKIQEVIKQK